MSTKEDHPVAYEFGQQLLRILIAVCIVGMALVYPHDAFVIGSIIYLLLDSFDLIP